MVKGTSRYHWLCFLGIFELTAFCWKYLTIPQSLCVGNASQEELEADSSAFDKKVLIGPNGLLLGQGGDVATRPSALQNFPQ